MTRSAKHWTAAVLLMLASAVWQRLSGPTYPVQVRAEVGGSLLFGRLKRTHGGPGDQPVRLVAPDTQVTGMLEWRRHPTSEPWRTTPFERRGDTLVAALPHQPPAGKLAYRLLLRRDAAEATVPERPVITRFKGDVPALVLAPHIAAMILALLFSARAGLGALAREPAARRLALLAAGVLAVGGFVLGPIALRYAFGTWWEGAPLGWDPTDNKTLIAGLAWAVALWRMRGGREARGAIVAAAAVTLVAFALPHSLWGTQIDWGSAPR